MLQLRSRSTISLHQQRRSDRKTNFLTKLNQSVLLPWASQPIRAIGAAEWSSELPRCCQRDAEKENRNFAHIQPSLPCVSCRRFWYRTLRERVPDSKCWRPILLNIGRPRQRKGRRNFVPISYLGGCMQCGRELPDDTVSISSIVYNSIPSMNGFFLRRRRRWAAVCNSHRPPRNQTRLGMQVKTEQKQILGMNSGSIYLTVIKTKLWMKRQR